MTFEIPFATHNRLTITLVPIFQRIAIILSITFQLFRNAKAVVWAQWRLQRGACGSQEPPRIRMGVGVRAKTLAISSILTFGLPRGIHNTGYTDFSLDFPCNLSVTQNVGLAEHLFSY